MFVVSALKCECNICDEGSNNTCITDGLCFTEVHQIDDEISYTYRSEHFSFYAYIATREVFLNRLGRLQSVERQILKKRQFDKLFKSQKFNLYYNYIKIIVLSKN